MKKSNDLVRIRNTRLSVLNTSDDIAQILMREIVGNEYAGKAALYHLASIFLDQDENIPDVEKALDDVVEYLLIVGSAAPRTSAHDIKQYLNIKRDMSLRKEQTANKPNPRFRELIQHVILSKTESLYDGVDVMEVQREHRARLETIVDELNLLYKAILIGSKPCDKITTKPADKAEYIPPQVRNAANALLKNFPILQRIEVDNYQDITAAIEIDALMHELDSTYKNQVRNYIERRIDEIVEAMDSNKERIREPRKCSAAEILVQAKIGYLFTRGVENLVPRISFKHFNDSDYELAVLSAVAQLTPKTSIMGEFSSARRHMRTMNILMHDPDAYRDKRLYQAHQQEMHRLVAEDRDSFVDKRDLIRHLGQVIGTAPGELTNTQKLLMRRLLASVVSDKKKELDQWNEFFSQYQDGIQQLDDIGMILLAYSSGMNVHYKIEYLDNDNDKPLHKRKTRVVIHGIGITNFRSKNALERQLRAEHNYSDDAPYLEEGELYFPIEDFDKIVSAFLATYVNNNILMNLRDRSQYEAAHFFSWRSPARLVPSYTPADKLIAQELMERYPIFSRIAPLHPDDIVNGIVLHTLQRHTNDDRLDPTATITQNLALWQVYSMNSLVNGEK